MIFLLTIRPIYLAEPFNPTETQLLASHLRNRTKSVIALSHNRQPNSRPSVQTMNLHVQRLLDFHRSQLFELSTSVPVQHIPCMYIYATPLPEHKVSLPF